MNFKPLVAIVLLAGCGPALADQRISPVQVNAVPADVLVVPCDASSLPRRADVERVLSIQDSTQTHALSLKLAGAVGEACREGVAAIAVHRGAHGRSLSWKPLRDDGRSVAAN